MALPDKSRHSHDSVGRFLWISQDLVKSTKVVFRLATSRNRPTRFASYQLAYPASFSGDYGHTTSGRLDRNIGQALTR
jgi:hypothetical protein